MNRCSRLLAILLVASNAPRVAAAGGDAPGVGAARCATEMHTPDNLIFPSNTLQSLANEIARRSPTFRSQLSKVGAVRSLRIQLRWTLPISSGLFRARTTILRTKAGTLIADSEIPVTLMFDRQYAEMIAHEIEHVIEQTEGLDLRALARSRRSGVYRLGGGLVGLFETDRATAAGEAVEREFLDGASAASCPGPPALIVPGTPPHHQN